MDDLRSNLMVLSKLLGPQYEVLTATSGARALKIAATAPVPDLILLDVLMPDVDGYAVLAKLRSNPATCDIPVIFVTGLDSSKDEERGLELGAVDYITKPYREHIVLARVHTQIQLKHARDRLRDQNAYLETEVARREAILYSITTTAKDAIVMIDDKGCVAFWNPAAERMFGYAANEIIGRELHALLTPPRFREAAARGLEGFKLNGEGGAVGKTIELAALRRDGTEFPMEISLAATRRGDAWWSVAIIRDITERKAVYAELTQTQAHLQRSDKLAALGQLAAGIVHEINNPVGFVNSNLGSLDGYATDIFEVLDAFEAAAGESGPAVLTAVESAARMAKQKDIGFLRDDTRQLIAESRDGLERVRKIVRDLKGFAHMDDDHWKDADLHEGIESTLNIVWNELKYHCNVHKDFGDIPRIRCLPSQLNQVFMNLLVNASQAIVGKGDITIRTGKQGDEVFVSIDDTGGGISEEHLQHMFEPFFTTKPVGQGTGLGLSLSRSIVQKHKGRIDVKSEIGKGTCFTVWLPIESIAVPPA